MKDMNVFTKAKASDSSMEFSGEQRDESGDEKGGNQACGIETAIG